MEDEAQHNIEEEKRKSRILTDVSTEFAKAPILKCFESGISGSLGPTLGSNLSELLLVLVQCGPKFRIIRCLIRDFKIPLILPECYLNWTEPLGPRIHRFSRDFFL